MQLISYKQITSDFETNWLAVNQDSIPKSKYSFQLPIKETSGVDILVNLYISDTNKDMEGNTLDKAQAQNIQSDVNITDQLLWADINTPMKYIKFAITMQTTPTLTFSAHLVSA